MLVFLSCRHRSPHPLRRAPVDPLDQQRQLRRTEHDFPAPIIDLRPDKPALVEPLREQAQTIAIPEHDLDQIGLAAPEREQVPRRSEEQTSELQSLMRISYAVFGLKKKNK